MRQRGFTLVEVLIATALLGVGALVTGQLLSLATYAVRDARVQTSTASLAVSRMEQLRGLNWTYDGNGNPDSDYSTNLATSVPTRSGTGLLPSPTGALEDNATGFADFLDAHGEWIAAGVQVPPRAVFVRRWSIEPVAGSVPDTLILQVIVRRVVDDRGAGGRRVRVAKGETRLVTLMSRTAR